MHALPDPTLAPAAAIGWFYLVTNATRVFTYLPQIVAVRRSTDGERAISLFTWGSWLVSHGAGCNGARTKGCGGKRACPGRSVRAGRCRGASKAFVRAHDANGFFLAGEADE